MESRKAVCLISVLLFMHIATQAAYSSELPAACKAAGEHDTTVLLLIDRSEKLTDVQPLEQTLQVVKSLVPPGGRLVVELITEKMANTRVILDLAKPKHTVWVSALKIRAGEKVFDDCFAALTKHVLEQNETYKTSAILETLSFAAKMLAADKAAVKKIVIYSDMIQNSPAISFYSTEKVDPAASFAQAKKEMMIYDLKGMKVYVGGAGLGVSDKKARAIEQFWKQYFETAGAELVFYGPVLPM